jgi:hypothetical protein
VKSNRKEVPKQAFSAELKKGEKYLPKGSPLVIHWKGIHDVFFLTTAHENVLLEAPSSRGAHHKIQPALLDYKYSVDRSDQMLSHYSFESKTKLWRKLLFYLFDLVMVNIQILHNKSSTKNTSLEIFYEKVTDGRITR